MARNTREELLRFQIEASGDKELAALAGKLDELAKGSDKSAAQAQALVAELEKLAATSANIKQFTTLKASIADTGDQLQKAKEKLAGLGAELDRTDKPTQALQRSLAKAAKDVENLTREQNKQQVALAKTTSALKAAGVDTDKLGDAYNHLQGDLDGFRKRSEGAASALEKTGKQSKSAAAGISTLDSAAKQSSKSLGDIAARLTLVSGAATAAIAAMATAGVGALFTGAIRSAATLEEALSQVKAVSGATAEEMVKLKEAAEQGGATTKFSTLEAAQGLGELARATGDANKAIAALPATLNLAQASGIGVAEAATLMTTTLTQFGLDADQAGRVADVMAKEVNSTTDSMAGLGNALTYAAPLAKQLGLDVEDTAAIIGVLADEGFRGERAGTALRNVFTELSNPASAFSAALRGLGIESTDFATIITELAKKGDEGRVALLQLDAAARPAITALVDKGGAKLAELESSLRHATGEAAKTAAEMRDNLGGAMESIKDSFDRTRRSLVEPLLEPLSDELFALSKELEAFAKSPEFKQIKDALKDLFVEGAKAAHELIEQIDFKALADKIKTFVTDGGTDLHDLSSKIGAIGETVVKIGLTFEVVFNTIQAVILGLAAAAAKVVAVLAGVADKVQGPGLRMLEFFGIIKEGTAGALHDFAGGMSAVADDFGGRFATNVHEAADAARALAEASADAGDRSEAGLGKAAAASNAMSDASKDLAGAAEQGKAALAGQAKGATESAKAAADAAAKAKEAAAALKAAFHDMGITSQADLKLASDNARKNFGLISEAVKAGKASAEDARRAFAAYAEAARVAVADSDAATKFRLEAELKVKASILDSAGAFKLLGDAGDDALRKIKPPADDAANALGRVGDNARGAAGGIDGAGSAAKSAGEDAKEGATGFDGLSASMGEMSAQAAHALVALNKYAAFSDIWAKNVNDVMGQLRQQRTALADVNAELDAQLEKFDPLAEELTKLRAQYTLADDNELRQIAQKRLQLQQEQQRVADESRRVAEQAAANQVRSQQETQTASPAPPLANLGAAATAARPIGVMGDARVIYEFRVLDGESVELYGPPDADQALQRMLDGLTRHKAVSVRRGGG